MYIQKSTSIIDAFLYDGKNDEDLLPWVDYWLRIKDWYAKDGKLIITTTTGEYTIHKNQYVVCFDTEPDNYHICAFPKDCFESIFELKKES